MEGKSGGSKPLKETNCMLIQRVGGTPTVQAKLGGVDMLCVVESASMVSFVTKDFCKKTKANAHPACC